jgi:predicted kinase
MKEEKTPVIVSNTNTVPKEFKAYVELAEKYDYKVIYTIVENRREGKSIHSVPEEKIEQMKNRFDIKL